MRIVFWSLTALMLVTGCGGGAPDDQPDLGTVTGKVTLDDKPLDKAVVTFTPVEGGRPSEGKTNEDGQYTLRYSASAEGATIGKHKVKVSTRTTIDDADGNEVQVPERVPDKYNKKTTLEKDVVPGENVIDLPLDGSGPITEDDEGSNRRSRDSCS